jgi:hypothetical protein
MEDKYGLSNEHLDVQMRMDAIKEKRDLLDLQQRTEELKKRNHPEHMQCIKKEGNDAMEEFSSVIEDEKERIQEIVDKEKERIMQERRTNGTNQNCPLCLEEIYPITSPDDNREGFTNTMDCCGAKHCHNCADKANEFMYGTSRTGMTNAKCFMCREPIHTPVYYAKTIKPDDKRHYLLYPIAECYANGTNGLKKNTKKAIKLYQRAAELGNGLAQNMLAQYYFYGISVPRCLQKARNYAEKAADQGEKASQSILAQLIEDSDNNSEEVFRLNTLAAFQGYYKGRFALGSYYMKRNELMTRGDEEWRRNLLLSIYWFGKTAEVGAFTPEACQSLAMMSIKLDEAMRRWHPRRRRYSDPLTGYSHIPFVTWALAKGGKFTDIVLTRPFDHPWKYECASCGSQDKEQLKACARCKAFHYCSKKCQVEHWKAGHKVDCKGHWIEKYFPAIRKGHTAKHGTQTFRCGS